MFPLIFPLTKLLPKIQHICNIYKVESQCGFCSILFIKKLLTVGICMSSVHFAHRFSGTMLAFLLFFQNVSFNTVITYRNHTSTDIQFQNHHNLIISVYHCENFFSYFLLLFKSFQKKEINLVFFHLSYIF